ncbi:MAG TPA: hypothetical protein DCL40_03890 [Coxiellaceae bacterium]|nr:hypothetical protein [Coxiellaceae bacterium]
MKQSSYSNAFSGCCGFQIHDVEPLCLSIEEYDRHQLSEGHYLGDRAVVTGGLLHLWKMKDQWCFSTLCLDENFKEVLGKGLLDSPVFASILPLLDAIQKKPSVLHRTPTGYQLLPFEREWLINNMQYLLHSLCVKDLWDWFIMDRDYPDDKRLDLLQRNFNEHYELLSQYYNTLDSQKDDVLQVGIGEILEKFCDHHSVLYFPVLKQTLQSIKSQIQWILGSDPQSDFLMAFDKFVFVKEQSSMALLGESGSLVLGFKDRLIGALEAIPQADYRQESHVIAHISTLMYELMSAAKSCDKPCELHPLKLLRGVEPLNSPTSVIADPLSVFSSLDKSAVADAAMNGSDSVYRPFG